MDDLISALRQIRTTGQVEPSLPTLAAAVERYHEQIAPIMESGSADLPPVTGENLDFHERNRALFRRSREQQAELSRILVVDFISLLYGSELLCYHLLLQSPYLELPLSEECRELLTMHLAMTAQADLEQRQPQAVLDLFAEAAGRHSDFLRTHADCYSGGDGSGAASPILLHLDGESASNEQMEMSLIRAYHSTVYPGTCTCHLHGRARWFRLHYARAIPRFVYCPRWFTETPAPRYLVPYGNITRLPRRGACP